jgi:hypothetical protein
MDWLSSDIFEMPAEILLIVLYPKYLRYEIGIAWHLLSNPVAFHGLD